jgi:protein-S-isoprenylcysteine O-methyltransferase Ste14
MGRILTLVYGAVAYAFFLGTFLYAIGFIGNLLVPKSVDGPSSAGTGTAIAIDIALMALFAVQHSIMARPGFKRWWTQFVPNSMERSTFVLSTNVVLVLLYWQWQPINTIVWSVENAVGVWVLWGLFALGWLIVLLSTFMIGHFHLFGLTQVYENLKGREPPPPDFKQPGFYRIVRHPIMVGFIIAFWAIPTMTVGHLLFAAVTTAYILVALQLEERDLLAALGNSYADYRSRVPMLLPFGRKQ